MLFLTKNQSVPKRFSSVSKALDSLNNLNKTLFHSLFGSGIINVSGEQLNSEGNFTFESAPLEGGSFVLSFKYSGEEPLIFSFQNEQEFKSVIATTFGNQFESYHIPLDETTLVAGDTVNKIDIPKRVFFPENFPTYSTPNFTVLYVNGTPQNSDHMELEETEDLLKVGFHRVRSGSVYPDPIDADGEFDVSVVEGATANVWLEKYGNVDPETGERMIRLQFSNFKSNLTPKTLVMEITNISSVETEYVHIARDVASEYSNSYYRLDEDRPEIIHVNFGYLSKLTSDNDDLLPNFFIKFYFVTKVEELSAFEGGISFSNKKFAMPMKNLTQVGSDFKVLALNRQTSRITDITSISSTLIGEAFRLDYENHSLEIFNVVPGLLSREIDIFVADFFYTPPLQLEYTHDIANTLGIFGTKGTSYTVYPEESEEEEEEGVLVLPNTLYLYAYLCDKKVDFVTHIDANAKLSTSHQLREADLRFLISASPNLVGTLSGCLVDKDYYEYILLGNLIKDGEDNYTLSVNTSEEGITSGYNRLLNLANQINIGGHPFNSYSINKTGTISASSSAGQHAYLTVANIPHSATKVELYGYLVDLGLRSGNTPRSYNAELVVRNHTESTEALIATITPNATGNTYFESVSPSLSDTPLITSYVSGSGTDRRSVSIKISTTEAMSDFSSYLASAEGNFYVQIS